ncbi:MAG: hypothetical protein JXR25_07130 [Pontiellaceae bacterium]|nr:hypothetical protein [Pontiellaceae bacterium]MBN2784584.1 hypothetical protein [Pontiellaceae bacterium]
MKCIKYTGWLVLALLTGCVTERRPRTFLEPAPLIPEEGVDIKRPVLFPEYFVMDEFELNDHGRIPQSGMIGAGLTSALDLSAVRTRFNDQLHFHEWTTDKMEIGSQYFRILASREGDRIEIRGVRGMTGPTQIFLLYTPKGR